MIRESVTRTTPMRRSTRPGHGSTALFPRGTTSRYDNPAHGCAFRTDATSATATVCYNNLHTYPWANSVGVILVDGVQTGTFTCGSPRGSVRVLGI